MPHPLWRALDGSEYDRLDIAHQGCFANERRLAPQRKNTPPAPGPARIPQPNAEQVSTPLSVNPERCQATSPR